MVVVDVAPGTQANSPESTRPTPGFQGGGARGRVDRQRIRGSLACPLRDVFVPGISRFELLVLSR